MPALSITDNELIALRRQLRHARDLAVEVAHQRDMLETQLADANKGQQELRVLLLRNQEQLALEQRQTSLERTPNTSLLSGPDNNSTQPAQQGNGQNVGADTQLPVQLREYYAVSEPSLSDWWGEVDFGRKLGARLGVTGLISLVLGIALHVAGRQHLIVTPVPVGYYFGLIGLFLSVIGVVFLF